MSKIIFTSRYIKGGVRGSNMVNYMARREGVEIPHTINSARPATDNQRKLIDEVVKSLPETAELFEYQDYTAAPTIGNASEFITAAFEQNPVLWDSVRNYVEYIARRPGAERSMESGHGLWNGGDQPLDLARVVNEVSSHKGNLWTHVVSLRREDAERLGYNNADAWRELVKSKLPIIAESMKIPLHELQWYGAFHNTTHHPHIHLIIYSKNASHGFLTEPNIERMRAAFGKTIFKQELLHIYERKDLARSQLNRFADERLRELALSVNGGDSAIGQMLVMLGGQLRGAKGKKQYGYLKPALKQQVDEIVRHLAADPRIDEMYRHWCELNADVKRIYTGRIDAPPPLEHEKPFRTIQNAVIREAVAAMEQAQTPAIADPPEQVPETVLENTPEPEAVLEQASESEPDPEAAEQSATQPPPPRAPTAHTFTKSAPASHAVHLLRHLAKMIRQDYEHQRQRYEQAVDHKLMAKIRRKQQDLGQKFE